jgi:hypothetical protein
METSSNFTPPFFISLGNIGYPGAILISVTRFSGDGCGNGIFEERPTCALALEFRRFHQIMPSSFVNHRIGSNRVFTIVPEI